MDKKLIFQGRVWYFGEDIIDTDQILPGYAMTCEREQLKDYVLAGSKMPDFAKKVQPGDIIVAGKNFGAGSSREQAPVALQSSGVGAVVAQSFARIFRRNAINIGLPVLYADLIGLVKNGDEITVDFNTGEITLPDGRTVAGQQPGESVRSILAAGGLIPKVRQQLQRKGGEAK